MEKGISTPPKVGVNSSEMMLAIGLMGSLVVLIVPLPPVLLDMFLAANVAVSILLMLITINVSHPLEISVFPSLLLLFTLGRLSLNVATTRLILLDGDAGKIVSAFGGLVVGGNLVVGIVIFLILIVIQFIVITKGAGRVSEVAARFTLDALPGKQMAIDAELGAGTIDEVQARKRREQLALETEFYGAMDGAGKFVRGDAIAGLVITAINLIGGIIIGMSNGLSMGDALHRYSILTIGDGLVSQIPALIIAITAGILVTKASSRMSLGSEIGAQLFQHARPLLIGALILIGLAFMPGLPKIPFFGLAAVLLFAWRRASQEKPATEVTAPDQDRSQPDPERHFDEFVHVDRACVEIGVRLISLVDPNQEEGLVKRIKDLRGELARKHGIWVPSVRIRDNIHLRPNAYRVIINGREVAQAELDVDALLAIDPGGTRGTLDGEPTKDPAFGLPAKWVSPNLKPRAALLGYTVVDPTTVLITHLGEILRKFAHELLSREDMQKLLDKLREHSPTIVDELKSELIRMGDLHQILLSLLEEQVPVTNLVRILETISQHAHKLKDPLALADCVRQQLGREILQRFRNSNGQVCAVVFEPRLESQLRDALNDRNLLLPPDALERLIVRIGECWQQFAAKNKEVVLLTDVSLRRPLRRSILRALPDISIVSYAEVPHDLQIEFEEMLKLEEVFPINNMLGDRVPAPEQNRSTLSHVA